LSRPKRLCLRGLGTSRSEGWTLAAREDGTEEMSSSCGTVVEGMVAGIGGGRSKIAIGLMPNNVWRFTKRVIFDSKVSLVWVEIGCLLGIDRPFVY